MGGPGTPPSLEAQVQMIKDAGYDDYYVTDGRGDRERLQKICELSRDAGLGIAAIFEGIDIIEAPGKKDLAALEKVLGLLAGSGRLEISMRHGEFGQAMGDQSLDSKAAAWLHPIVELLEKHGVHGSLYPHFGLYLETFTDALRLAEAVSSPSLGVIFCGYHWFRVAKEPSISELFNKVGARLNAVNLSGSEMRTIEINGLNPSIDPLDTGTLDNTHIVQELQRLSYQGPIGIQGYGVSVSPQEALLSSATRLKQLLVSSQSACAAG